MLSIHRIVATIMAMVILSVMKPALAEDSMHVRVPPVGSLEDECAYLVFNNNPLQDSDAPVLFAHCYDQNNVEHCSVMPLAWCYKVDDNGMLQEMGFNDPIPSNLLTRCDLGSCEINNQLDPDDTLPLSFSCLCSDSTGEEFVLTAVDLDDFLYNEEGMLECGPNAGTENCPQGA